ncbi:DUF4286 family protein [Sphingobacterium lactis]|uniref:DUF4286 family protein n=1 Tax=Sphingobacterium lactis TaxID=797291 RepID=UPI003DA24087
MFLYNVSLIIEDSIHLELLDYTKKVLQQHPDSTLKLLKMLHSPHEGQTYCLQAVVNSEVDIEGLRELVIRKIQEQINAQHPEKAFLFESIMQYIPHD